MDHIKTARSSASKRHAERAVSIFSAVLANLSVMCPNGCQCPTTTTRVGGPSNAARSHRRRDRNRTLLCGS
jgi:hypothetical protein